jgi:hypothetical protein
MTGESSTLPTTTTIRAFLFQPFESRQGIDVVVGLRFDYDPALIAHLKHALDAYKAQAVNPELRRRTPGGWLAQHRCWFVEPEIWELVSLELAFHGYRILPEVRP